MNVNNVELEISAVRRSQYPESNLPEFIMLGRSNVGKSSFVNTLLNRKQMARTSSKPGKTNTLNFYNIDNKFYLVDVPGYGYANTSKDEIYKFGLMVEEYLKKREELKRAFLIVDLRHVPTEDDKIMYNFLKHYQIPVSVIATKSDKVNLKIKNKNIKAIQEMLDIVVGDDIVIFSSVSKVGREEALEIISKNI